MWASSTRRSRLICSAEVPRDDIQVQDQYRYGFVARDGEEEGGFGALVILPDTLMKVSGRELFSPRPLADDGRKPLLCVIPDQSGSQNAAYCHFKVAVHLHATPAKCP